MEARQMFVEEWTEIIGTTQPLPDRSARVSAGVEGHVISVLGDGKGKAVVEGQLVKKGDVLVRLDDRIARAGLEKAQADQKELKQQVDQARLGARLAAIRLEGLEAVSKQNRLNDQALVSPVQIEEARVALEEAKSKQTGAELKVKAGEAHLQELGEQLQLYTLTAPISGRLSRILVVLGQTLPVGAPVAEIIDVDEQIDLLGFVPPYIARKLREGQLVRISAGSEKSQGPAAPPGGGTSATEGGKGISSPDGKIVYIADQAEVDTGNFAVKARFHNTGRALRSNITTRARVLTTPGKASLTLPESALMEDQDPPAVIVVENHKEEKTPENKDIETGTARKLLTKVGIRDRVLHLVEIIALDDPEKKWQGSLETAKFVIEKGQGLRNGDAIKLEEEDEDEAAPAEQKKE
jgi:RND family efflux transporter MFP subunit